MNSGAVLLDPNYADVERLRADYQRVKASEWAPTWADGSYASNTWRVINMIEKRQRRPDYDRFPYVAEISERFKCNIEMMVFYSLLPGGVLHPHRDMSGAVGLGGVRFHIPVITNPDVDFRVSGERVLMRPGELWALDTSYVHAVANHGAADRIHLVIEVEVNDFVRSMLPKLDHRYYLHQARLVGAAAWKAANVVVREPRRLGRHLSMARKVAGQIRRKVLERRPSS